MFMRHKRTTSSPVSRDKTNNRNWVGVSLSTTFTKMSFIGLTEVSSMSSTRTMTSHLDIKETELRLGSPGREFQDRKHRSAFGSVSAFGLDSGDEDTRLRISLNPTRNSCSGAKRGFYDAIDGCRGLEGGVNGAHKSQGRASEVASEGSSEWEKAKNDRGSQLGSAATAPAAKAQIVGWPPIHSFRKNITASALAKSSEDVEGKSALAGCLYVKVSMDGAPYLRKVDLKNYKTYAELLTALERMFSRFTIASGSRASKELPGGEISSQKQLSHPGSSSEYVLTYEDKDGDWMLVGDVPWREFMTYSVLAQLPDCTGEKCRNRD